MADVPENGIDLHKGDLGVRITGRDVLLVVMLAAALGYIIWQHDLGQQERAAEHLSLRAAIIAHCLPKSFDPF